MLHLSKGARIAAAGALALGIGIFAFGCRGPTGVIGAQDAAERVYVAPGEHDEFYAFLSGGYSGQVSVWGLPSARLLRVIPVFSQDPETGYGYSEETRHMLETSLGFIPWDDSHHPLLSRTDGLADGRWLFINGNNTPRIARICLRTFRTQEIIELPNTGGNHASAFPTENTEYIVGATRFSVPIGDDQARDVPIETFRENFDAAVSFVSVDPQSGEMNLAFQLRLPPYHWDLGRAGMGPSADWVFFTSYNVEQAYTLMEVGASQYDKDFIAAINWRMVEAAARDGAGTRVGGEFFHNYHNAGTGQTWQRVHNGTRVIDPTEVPGAVFFMPTPRSPHGVDIDPTGEFIVAGGKLATVIPVHSFSQMIAAIEREDFVDVIDGIPVLRYEATMVGEVADPGLGPLHTEFDGRGYAYTSVYISSEIVKWSLSTFEVVDRIPAYYSIGHLMIIGGDTRQPEPRYLLGMTKTARDRFLPTGPKQSYPAQLYDISGERMVLLKDFPTVGEPHYANAIRADLLTANNKRIYRLDENQHPRAVKRPGETRVVREGNVVRVYMSSIRSHFRPDNIEGIRLGDTVYFHVTNLEQDWDVKHSFAIKGANKGQIMLSPGETATLRWTPTRVGIFPFYCTAFCSALHQEMQGYVRVSPAGSDVPLAAWTGDRQQGAVATR